MTAEEMFEELGFEQTRNDDNYIEYVRNGLGGYISILFSLRWKSIKSTYGYQARGTNYHEIPPDELKAIIQQAKELGWLEEKDENFEEKPETNYEHFKDEIVQKFKYNLAVVNGEPKPCEDTNCDECDFKCSCCGEKRFEWLASPYKKPTYKLSKFEFDLIQTYRDCNNYCKLSDRRILLELKDKGYFMDVDYDTKIQDILANCEAIK